MTRFHPDCQTAEVFHRESRLGPQAAARLKDRIEEWMVDGSHSLEWNEPPDAQRLRLPPPRLPRLLGSFSSLLCKRRSWRDLSGDPLSARQAAMLLWCAVGVTGKDEAGGPLLTIPTAGGLRSTSCYLASSGGQIPFGTWRYRSSEHELVRVSPAAPATISSSVMAPGDPTNWPNLVLITARLGPLFEKYGERGYRFALLEAGHAAQNILLACEGLGLGAVPVGGFDEEALLPGLSPAADEALLYLVGIGEKA